MKVHLGKYTNWVGPFQIAEMVFFWKDKYEDDIVHEFGEFLAYGFAKKTNPRSLNDDRPKTWLYKLCEWVESKKKRKIKIKIDPWDTWSADATIAMLVLPLLKQLRASKHGSGYIDLNDVPVELRYSETEEYDAQECFEFYHKSTDKLKCDVHTRYEWALDEMIWTFEQLQPDCDWEAQYSTGDIDFEFGPVEGKNLSKMVHGPNHTYKVDWAARNAHQARIVNGLRLFGKYMQTLWD